MIRNVIFDIGMVLKGWHPEKVFTIFEPKVAESVYQAVFGSGYWTQMDLGILEDEELMDKMVASAPQYREEILYFLNHLSLISERFSYAIPWIDQLKEYGLHVFYLSNYSRHLRKNVPETIDFLPLMEGGIFSSDRKVMKPDQRIYQMLCDDYHLKPEECLFIDDAQANVDGAIAFGMKAVRFEGYDQSYPVIMNLLKQSMEGNA